MSTLSISFAEVFHDYSITVEQIVPNKGYKIVSDCPTLKEEAQKIQHILACYRTLEIVESQRKVREEKFQSYVAWRPESEWGNVAEYRLYLSWKTRLENAQRALADVKVAYQVTDISLFES